MLRYEAQYFSKKQLAKEAKVTEEAPTPTEKVGIATPLPGTSKSDVAHKAAKDRSADQDLDAYLLGPDSGDEGAGIYDTLKQPSLFVLLVPDFFCTVQVFVIPTSLRLTNPAGCNRWR